MNDNSTRRRRRWPWLAALALSVTGFGMRPAPQAPHHTSKTVIVRMKDDMRFHPETAVVAPGDTIVWINEGAMPHTATDKPGTAAHDEHNVLPPGAEPFDSGLLQSGERFQHVFTVAGDYTYLCFLHEGLGMIGQVRVEGRE